jgi:hypothetical protein
MLLALGAASAGDLEPPGGPEDPVSAMHTLDDVYNRLTDNTAAVPRSGPFQEPAAPPGATGHTLDEVYDLAIPTRVEKTGQTTSYAAGDDGELETGVAWPNPRFADNGDGTVADNLTRLVWLKNVGRFPYRTWAEALADCRALADDGVELTDGSTPGDWRLPSIRELHSVIHYGVVAPAVPNTAGTGKAADGDPFQGVPGFRAWSGTSRVGGTQAFAVNLFVGHTEVWDKIDPDSLRPWCMRDVP